MKVPDCSHCNAKFDKIEYLNTHMMKRHQESDNDRMNRLTQTFQSSLDSEKAKMDKFICDLCDKPFTSMGQKVNHMIHIHTVGTTELHCDFCEEIYRNKEDLCKHISANHAEYFIKKEKTEQDEDKEEGEVVKDIVIIDEEKGSYVSGSWGPKDEETKEGFSFKGKKKEFLQAALEVQGLFYTNKEHEIDNVKFSLEKKWKDEKGSGQSYSIKLEKGNENGFAVLKTWDKNSKKEFKINVIRSKESDLSFVKTLSDVVRYLLDKSISGEGWGEMKSVNKVPCQGCDKLFSSERYMRSHATKIHRGPKSCTICSKILLTEKALKSHVILCHKNTIPEAQAEVKNAAMDRKRKAPAKEVQEVKKCTESNDGNGINKTPYCQKCKLNFNTEIEVNKHMQSEHSTQVRQCSDCDLIFDEMTIKEWIIVKNKHVINECLVRGKEEKTSSDQYECEECDFTSMSNLNMMKHKRDDHEAVFSTVSPAKKKRRREDEEDEEPFNNMDVDETEDIAKQIETLTILEKGEDVKGEDVKAEQKRLSDQMDDKVRQKQKRNDEEDVLFTTNLLDKEKKRKLEQEIFVKDTKTKNTSKRKYRKKVSTEKESFPVNHEKWPKGVEEIDPKFHHMVGDTNIKYPGPMNGNCQGASKAALLFQDPSKGPELSAAENEYLITHWEYFKDFIVFPHTIKVLGGTNITFENEQSFHKYLWENPESNYMWGDHQQLQITSNMYNVKINILTINHNGQGSVLKEPFMPDPRLREFARLPPNQAVAKDMMLMYSNGNHFDALIGKNHPLLTMGTISDLEKEENKKDKDYTFKEKETNDDKKDKDKIIKDLQNKIKQVEDLYRGSEDQVKELEEEKDRLKIDVKELTEYIQKTEHFNNIKGKEQTSKVCTFFWNKKKEKHVEKDKNMSRIIKDKEEQMYNCEQCSFQSTLSTALSKHMNITHRNKHEQSRDTFKCNDCELQFSEKWNLMHHRQENHEVTEVCEYLQKGKCKFMPPKICWLLHTKKASQSIERNIIECYVCKEKVRTRNGMMRHGKHFHIEVVPECKEFSLGKCDFAGQDKMCWFKHTEKSSKSHEQDFQVATDNLAPPAQE